MNHTQNVILITIDCLRVDCIGCLGHRHQATPNIDDLVRNGVLFSQAISNGVGTPESFPSIMTSTYPLMSPNSGGLHDSFWVKLSSKWHTIAEVLRSREFSTAAFNANPWLTSIFHYDRGFDIFDDSLKSYRRNNVFDKLRRKLGTLRGDKFLRAKLINKKAFSWLRNNLDRFFLWLHYMDVHSPYNPKKISKLKRIDAIRLERKISRNPQTFSKKELERWKSFYQEEIAYVDREIGFFLDELEHIGISSDNTFLILTADHGEQFMEHGEWGHGRLYDEVLRVPVIVNGPGIIRNTVIENQVSLLDLAPTIVDLFNIPKVQTFLGTSLVPMMKDGGAKSNKYVISETLTQNFSCRTEDWKYITDRKDRRELYNLQVDPNEKTNLASRETKKVKELNAIVSKHILMEEKAKQSIPEEHAVLHKKEMEVIKERLKQLGYL